MAGTLGFYGNAKSGVSYVSRKVHREENVAGQRKLGHFPGYYTQNRRLVEEAREELSIAPREVAAVKALLEAGDVNAAAEALINITPLLTRLGWGRLLESLYERALPGVEKKTMTTILQNMASSMQKRGDYAAALGKYEQALKIKEELGDREGVINNLNLTGNIYYLKGDYAAALEKYTQALNAATESGHQAGMSKSLHNIGAINQADHKYAEALAKYEQSLKLKEELGDRAGLAKSLHQVGIIYQMIGDYSAALEKFGEALKIKEEIGDRAGVARSLQQVGNIYYLKHDYTAALGKYEQSLKIKKKLGDRLGIANSYGQIGLVFKATGREAEAFKYLYHALAIFNQLQSPDANMVMKNLGSLKIQKNKKSLMRLSTKRRRVMKGQSGGGRKIYRSMNKVS